MFNTTGYSLSDIAAATGTKEDGLFGGNNAWWIILLFMFAGGWGNGGWGGNAARGDFATKEDIRAAVDQQTLLSKLDNQAYGLADSTYALNNSLMNGFHGVDTAICNLGYQTQQGFNTLGNQMASCCCETQRALERGFCDVNYNMATQACDTRRAISDGVRDIIDNQNAGTRQILDFLTQDKIAALTAENQTLRFAQSQTNQNLALGAMMDSHTAEILRRVAPTPIPSYTVPAPVPFYGYAACGCN